MASSSIYEKGKEAMAMATSVAASVMLVRSLANELLPNEARDMLSYGLANLRARMKWRHSFSIEQTDGPYSSNYLFYHVKTYLASRMEAVGATNALQHLRLSIGTMDDEDTDKLIVSMEEGEEMVDVYEGAEFRWCLYSHDVLDDSIISRSLGRRGGKLYYHVTFHKKHKEKALSGYIDYIIKTAKDIRNKERPLTMYTNDDSDWTPEDFCHPSNFATLAMNHALKKSVIDDLEKFITRKAFYKRIGKAWKRGYLFYGPPGTGKSSLIAAMANYLRFDLYYLELTGVENNSQLRKLLLGMTNKSILVIEDIDCTIELKQRDDNKKKPPKSSDPSKDEKVTLSGLLNFVDGLWSTTGEERIIVFTTNYKERLDPALLRPGRMDMHVHMGYCTPEAFRILVDNYLSKKEVPIDNHRTYPEIDELLAEVAVTPAEMAEALLRSKEDLDVAETALTSKEDHDDDKRIDVALGKIVEFLKSKKECANKKKEAQDAKKEKDVSKEADDDAKKENDVAKKEEDDNDSDDDDDDDETDNKDE
ncbi:AAA-ATPase At3g50940-like [Lolium perenne]|uniref:AAA-ATPase At3g50940-like n=1 Tax=Lolium perenne TaxID=4522 RepID=UPI0021F5523A|nr:AAA-ATPase At3g50940-like [Lolium perenne]